MKKQQINKVIPFVAFTVGSLFLMTAPSFAQTTTSTDPDSVLTSFQNGTGKMDDIGGAAAALGMSSAIFGGAALIFKRFIYS
jgi:hypothetical protein